MRPVALIHATRSGLLSRRLQSAMDDPGQPSGTAQKFGRLATWLWGTDPITSRGLRQSIVASVAYLASIPGQWLGVMQGLVQPMGAWLITPLLIMGAVGFHLMIRLGWTRRMSDPMLTVQQMIHAFVTIALSYIVDWHIRGMMASLAILTLTFGAFTLSPRQCRSMGVASAVLIGGAAIAATWLHRHEVSLTVEFLYFTCVVIALPLTARLAGQLSRIRMNHKQQRKELRDALERLNELATVDGLTRLFNRRHMSELLESEALRIARGGGPMCVAVIDLDHFKRVNDSFGHDVGDEALRIFAREGKAILRKSDWLARWGGEEFLLAFVQCSMPGASDALERLRARLQLPEAWQSCPEARVTFSAGLAMCVQGQSVGELVKRADAALYEAKRKGRNRTELDMMAPSTTVAVERH